MQPTRLRLASPADTQETTPEDNRAGLFAAALLLAVIILVCLLTSCNLPAAQGSSQGPRVTGEIVIHIDPPPPPAPTP